MTDVTAEYDTGAGVGIVGSVTLPATLRAGSYVVVDVGFDTAGSHASLNQTSVLGRDTNVITYRWTNVPADATNVTVGLLADVDGDQSPFETGDYAGYSGGTTAQPIMDWSQAKAFALGGACTSGIDFAAGTQP